MYTYLNHNIYYVGCNDHTVDLFEGQYVVPNGMAYNSYVLMGEKIAVMDTIDQKKTTEWLQNIDEVLQGRLPDYLVIQHMEPDHSASIEAFVKVYPQVTVVANDQIFTMIGQYFPELELCHELHVKEGDVLHLGMHDLNFVAAPMVHWPEVMMTYESRCKVLFSADGFGKFGALDVSEPWADEARRYYIGIVGKYGDQVQAVLKKAATLEIQMICPLHGPVLKEDLAYYLNLYDRWSSYMPEEEGVVVCYTSVYGHTKQAVYRLCAKLEKEGAGIVKCYDLAREDMSQAVADAFRYDKLVLATTTYNGGIYPFMKFFIDHLTERNFRNRTVAFIENGTWAPAAMKQMKEMLDPCVNLEYVKNNITIRSALSEDNMEQLQKLAEELTASYKVIQVAKPEELDPAALMKIGYGLYVVTTNDGTKDNGCIVNTVTQVAGSPLRIIVSINKANYTCDIIKKTKELNISTLAVDAPFSLLQRFGMQTGRKTDKFAGFPDVARATNGRLFLKRFSNSYMSCKVECAMDFGSHCMFICSVTEGAVLNSKATMTYDYYQNNVKPKPKAAKKGFVCKVCGYVYEGDELPEDFICPLCKHGADDFEKL